MIGPPQMIAPQDLPGNSVAGQMPGIHSSHLQMPDGSYSSLVEGPSYGKQYVMPEDQRIIEYDTPGFLEANGAGERLATGAYDTAKSAVNAVGGFFSNLFGGGDEKDAKAKMKAKIAQKLANKKKN